MQQQPAHTHDASSYVPAISTPLQGQSSSHMDSSPTVQPPQSFGSQGSFQPRPNAARTIADDGVRSALQSAPPRPSAIKVVDALQFLDQLKLQFGRDSPTYTQLLDVMKDFKAATSGIPDVVRRIRQLLNGYPHLVQGFSIFVPPEYAHLLLEQ